MPEVAEVHGFADVCNEQSAKTFVSGRKSEVHKGQDLFSGLGYASFSVSARARGKELILSLRDKATRRAEHVLFKFGLTGSFQYFAPGSELSKYAHVVFKDADGGHLAFVDQMRFGTFQRVRSEDDWGSDRGPDPVDEYEAFCKNVARTVVPGSKYWNKPVCEVLLLQEVFNGIGNFLRAEVLHEAGVTDPFTKTGKVFADLTEENCTRNRILELCKEIPGRFMAKKALSDADFLAECKVYQRAGSLSRKDSNGRTVWWEGEKKKTKKTDDEAAPERPKRRAHDKAAPDLPKKKAKKQTEAAPRKAQDKKKATKTTAARPVRRSPRNKQ